MTVQIERTSNFEANEFLLESANRTVMFASDNHVSSLYFPEGAEEIVSVSNEYLHPENSSDLSYVTTVMFNDNQVGYVYWQGPNSVTIWDENNENPL
jgi:hypothetical protein